MMNATCRADSFQTIFTLPRTIRTTSIVQACRSSLVDFVEHAVDWNKADLVQWLTTCDMLMSHARDFVQERRGINEDADMSSVVDSDDLVEILEEARAYAFGLLKASATPRGGEANAARAVIDGLVIVCEDRSGDLGWLPIATPGSLEDRLTALWAADYLVRVNEYEALLAMCACGRITFDGTSRLRGSCEEHSVHRIEIHWSTKALGMLSSPLFRAAR